MRPHRGTICCACALDVRLSMFCKSYIRIKRLYWPEIRAYVARSASVSKYSIRCTRILICEHEWDNAMFGVTFNLIKRNPIYLYAIIYESVSVPARAIGRRWNVCVDERSDQSRAAMKQRHLTEIVRWQVSKNQRLRLDVRNETWVYHIIKSLL